MYFLLGRIKKRFFFRFQKGYVNYRPITAIRAFDQKLNGNGAYATIKSGGINATSTVVHFKSQRGHGINFILEIYVK